MPSQIWLRKFAAGCSVRIVDTRAIVRSWAVGTSNLQNLTASCGKSSLFYVWKANKFSLFDGNHVYLLLVFWVWFSDKVARMLTLKFLDVQSFTPAHEHTATVRKKNTQKDTERSLCSFFPSNQQDYIHAACPPDPVAFAQLRPSGYMDSCC